MYSGAIGGKIHIQVNVYSNPKIQTAWIEDTKNGSLFIIEADINLFSVSLKTFHEGTKQIQGYVIHFDLPVISPREQTLNLWVRNYIGENVLKFYVKASGIHLTGKQSIHLKR